jgi:hypothetical protein
VRGGEFFPTLTGGSGIREERVTVADSERGPGGSGAEDWRGGKWVWASFAMDWAEWHCSAGPRRKMTREDFPILNSFSK